MGARREEEWSCTPGSCVFEVLLSTLFACKASVRPLVERHPTPALRLIAEPRLSPEARARLRGLLQLEGATVWATLRLGRSKSGALSWDCQPCCSYPSSDYILLWFAAWLQNTKPCLVYGIENANKYYLRNNHFQKKICARWSFWSILLGIYKSFHAIAETGKMKSDIKAPWVVT